MSNSSHLYDSGEEERKHPDPVKPASLPVVIPRLLSTNLPPPLILPASPMPSPSGVYNPSASSASASSASDQYAFARMSSARTNNGVGMSVISPSLALTTRNNKSIQPVMMPASTALSRRTSSSASPLPPSDLRIDVTSPRIPPSASASNLSTVMNATTKAGARAGVIPANPSPLPPFAPTPAAAVKPKLPSTSIFACFRSAPSVSSIYDIHLHRLVPAGELPAFLAISLRYLMSHLDQSASFFLGSSSPARLKSFEDYLEGAMLESEVTSQGVAGFGVETVGAFLVKFLSQLPECVLATGGRIGGSGGIDAGADRYEQLIRAANMAEIALNPALRPRSSSSSSSAASAVRPAATSASNSTSSTSATLREVQRALFPALTTHDHLDQFFMLQSLLSTLPSAHFTLYRRIVELLAAIVEQISAVSGGIPRIAEEEKSLAGLTRALLGEGFDLSPAGAVELQRLSLLFASVCIVPPASMLPSTKGSSSNTAKPSSSSSSSSSSLSLSSTSSSLLLGDPALHRAREQQLLSYSILHCSALFSVNPLRVLAMPVPLPLGLDPNPELLMERNEWRRAAQSVRVEYGRLQYDARAMVKAFRAWRNESKTNKRKGEAYRQLALLKNELIEERHKSALLARELHGLQEEHELRDFRDQLRSQSAHIVDHHRNRIGTARDIGLGAGKGAGPARYAIEPPQRQNERLYTVDREEKTNRTHASAPVRDLTYDISSVKRLQEQDRMMTQTYAGY